MRLTTLGGPAQGVLCEERVLPISAVLPIPDAMSFEEAACLPVAGLAAWSALTTEARIGPGSHVLLSGTGGVSMMGLGIAKALGAHVAMTSSSDQKLERVAALGVDLTVNYRSEGWAERVREWSGGGVDVVLDIGGAENSRPVGPGGARRRPRGAARRWDSRRPIARSGANHDAPDPPPWDLCREPRRARPLCCVRRRPPYRAGHRPRLRRAWQRAASLRPPRHRPAPRQDRHPPHALKSIEPLVVADG